MTKHVNTAVQTAIDGCPVLIPAGTPTSLAKLRHDWPSFVETNASDGSRQLPPLLRNRPTFQILTGVSNTSNCSRCGTRCARCGIPASYLLFQCPHIFNLFLLVHMYLKILLPPFSCRQQFIIIIIIIIVVIYNFFPFNFFLRLIKSLYYFLLSFYSLLLFVECMYVCMYVLYVCVCMYVCVYICMYKVVQT